MYYLRLFDPWKNKLCTCPPKYSLSPYTGCSHFCLYCYATSYIGLRKSTPKKDFLRRLARDLAKADRHLPVSMSNSSDPYPPEERSVGLTRATLRLLREKGFRVMIVTKSDIVLRDVDILAERGFAVSLTITTLDSNLARRLEPAAPPPDKRLRAVEVLSENGVPVVVRIDPVIPGLTDKDEDLIELVDSVVDAGAKHVVTSTYKAKPDNFARMLRAFPEKAETWRELYLKRGERIGGYWYLPRNLRERMLQPVTDQARKRGITYATCREGLTSKRFFNAPTCDGTHLLRT